MAETIFDAVAGSANNNLTSMYALNRLYRGDIATTSTSNEVTLSENWDNYRLILVLLRSSANILLASTIAPSEYIESVNTNIYVSYTSDSQTVLYTNFDRTNKNKVKVWSNNSNTKKIDIYGIMKKIS